MKKWHAQGATVDIRRTSLQALESVVRHTPSRWFLGLCLLSAFCVGGTGHAQDFFPRPLTGPVDTAGTSAFSRLTVRPHTMTLGTATTTAGVHQLDSLPGYLLYVPESCVGTRRVPLVLMLHGGAGDGQMVLDEQREMANKYGMILLAPTGAAGWDVVNRAGLTGANTPEEVSRPLVSRNVTTRKFQDEFRDVQNIDRALKYVLKNFAIDPDKIAVGGFSDGGTYAMFLGHNNEDVFSQVMPMGFVDYFDGSLGSRNKNTRFLLIAGTDEWGGPSILTMAREVRAEGHDVQVFLSLRSHAFLTEERNYAWNWLAQGWGWKGPSSLEALHPSAFPDNDSLLTTDALAKMTTFWQAVTAEPDSIQTTALKTHQVYSTMKVGQERVTTVKTDLAAIVAAYPSIAAALTKAGLTVQQEEAYRIALMRLHFFDVTKSQPENPTMEQNIAFKKSHLQEFDALWHTSIWAYENVQHGMSLWCCKL